MTILDIESVAFWISQSFPSTGLEQHTFCKSQRHMAVKGDAVHRDRLTRVGLSPGEIPRVETP